MLAVALPVIFLGAWRIGVTWDEPFHVQRLQHYFDSGWFLSDGSLVDGQPAPHMTQQYVYSPVTMLMLHGLCIALGVEGPGEVSTTAHAYALRHIGIGLIGCLGVLVVATTARLVFRRWAWAAVAGAVLVSMPLWTGYSMFSVKDVSVATGYALVTLGLVTLVRQEPQRVRRVASAVSMAAGTVLSVGTRPGMWTGIAVSCVVAIVCVAVHVHPRTTRERLTLMLWTICTILAAVLGTGVVLWLVYPKVFGSPFHALHESVSATTAFRAEPAPVLFTPVHMLFQLPLLSFALVVVGSILVTVSTLRSRLRIDDTQSGMLIVCCQAFAMPVGAMLTRASLYGDLRQELFAVPSAALIVTYALIRWSAQSRARTERMVLSGVVVVGLLVPFLTQFMLFPYNYSWHNPLSALGDLPVRGDYQRGSGREVVDRVPAGRVVCSPARDQDGNATRGALIDGWQDCGRATNSPLSAYRRHPPTVTDALGPDEFWAVQFDDDSQIPTNCQVTAQVTRSTPWHHVRMATVSRCALPYPVLGPEVRRFDSSNGAPLSALLDEGWYIPMTDGSDRGYLAHDDRATITFQLKPPLVKSKVRIHVGTVGNPIASLTLAGRALLPDTEDPGGITFDVPPELVSRAISRPITLEFSAPHGQELRLNLLSFEVGE